VPRDVPQQPSSLLVAAEELSADSTNGDVQIALTQAAPYTTPRALYSTSLVPYATIPLIHNHHVHPPFTDLMYSCPIYYIYYIRAL